MAIEKFFTGLVHKEAMRALELSQQLAEFRRTGRKEDGDRAMADLEQVLGNISALDDRGSALIDLFVRRGMERPGEEMLDEIAPHTASESAQAIVSGNGNKVHTVFSAPPTVSIRPNGSQELTGRVPLSGDEAEAKSQIKERPMLRDLTDIQEKVAHSLFSLPLDSTDFKTDKEIAGEVCADDISAQENDLDREYLLNKKISTVLSARRSVANKLDVMSSDNYLKGRFPKMEALIDWIRSLPEFKGLSLQILAKVARKEISLSKLRALRNKEPESNGQDYALTGVEKRFLAGRLKRLMLDDGLFCQDKHLLISFLSGLEDRQKRLHPADVQTKDIESLRRKLLALCGLIDGVSEKQVLRDNPNEDMQELLRIFEIYKENIKMLPGDAINNLLVIMSSKS